MIQFPVLNHTVLLQKPRHFSVKVNIYFFLAGLGSIRNLICDAGTQLTGHQVYHIVIQQTA